jgi:hypothetical protein
MTDSGPDTQGIELRGDEGFEMIDNQRFAYLCDLLECETVEQQGVATDRGRPARNGGVRAAERAADLAVTTAGV